MPFVLWLVVAVGVKGEVAEEFSGGWVNDAGVEVVDEHDDVGSGVGSPHADVVKGSCVSEGDGSCVANNVVPDSVVAFDAGVSWGGFG